MSAPAAAMGEGGSLKRTICMVYDSGTDAYEAMEATAVKWTACSPLTLSSSAAQPRITASTTTPRLRSTAGGKREGRAAGPPPLYTANTAAADPPTKSAHRSVVSNTKGGGTSRTVRVSRLAQAAAMAAAAGRSMAGDRGQSEGPGEDGNATMRQPEMQTQTWRGHKRGMGSWRKRRARRVRRMGVPAETRVTTSPIGTQDRSAAQKKATKAQYAPPRRSSLESSWMVGRWTSKATQTSRLISTPMPHRVASSMPRLHPLTSLTIALTHATRHSDDRIRNRPLASARASQEARRESDWLLRPM
mmetsp:Transcript_9798/g.32501  ORF Transcript_9798/g.32501 Transcript_9798/m.32501 type:complete len:303 (-) Transcript_9798:63-971(-)